MSSNNNNFNFIIMKVFATLSNGNQIQIEVFGDKQQILQFMAEYKGNDLGNDLICQRFVTDFEETGVVIFAD